MSRGQERTAASDGRVDLIGALRDVASAVSSTLSVDEVLERVVDAAKRVTNTEKAVLCLVADDRAAQFDAGRVVVRGSRGEHLESWWRGELERMAPAVFSSLSAYVEQDSENRAWLLGAPITVQDRPIGLLVAINSEDHAFTADQVAFLAILGAFAAAAIENARLAEATRYAMLAGERERIASEMHDGLSQSLFGIALGLEVCKKRMTADPEGVNQRMEEIQDLLASSMVELRRYIYDLRPSKLQELGLVGAIEYWVHALSSGAAVRGRVITEGEERKLPPDLEVCVYRVAREAATNVVRHADATEFTVTLRYADDAIEVVVVDDGVGFDVESALGHGETGRTMGLVGVRQRVGDAGGAMEIVSTKGGGTVFKARIPHRPVAGG